MEILKKKIKKIIIWCFATLPRKIISFVVIAVLIGGPISFLLFRGETAEAAWWNDSWAYRKTIAITNSSGSDQTDFQVKALANVDLSTDITDGKVKSDLGDLRFTDINGNVLPYWIEDSTAASVDVWVKAPSLPTSGATIYMYYGNPSAGAGKTKVGTQAYPGLSCKSILDAGDSTGTGNYWIDPTNGNTSDSFQAYCDMTNDSGGWMLATQSMIQSGANNLSTTATTSDNNGGLITTIAFTGPTGCGQGYRSYQLLLKDTIPWTKIRADYEFYGGNSCWGVFGNGSYNSGSNLIAFVLETDTIRNQVKMGGSAGDNFDGINVRCDNETTNFWHGLQGDVTRSAQVVLRRNSMSSYAGLSTGAECVGYAYGFKYSNIYIREDSMEPANITAGSPGSEEKGTGPVAYWKFDEGFGTTAKDSTTNNQTQTFSGSPTWQTEDMCISGKCLNFDTDDSDYSTYTVSSASPLNLGTSNFTVSHWQKVFQPVTHGSGIIGRYPHSTDYNGNWSTGISDDRTTYFFFHRNTSGETYNPGIDYSSYFGKWVYVSWVKSGSAFSLYIDGVLKQSWTPSITFNVSFSGVPFYLSNTGWSPGTMSNLMIDELKIYNYARSVAQIKMDYNVGLAGAGGAGSGGEGTAVSIGAKSQKWMSDGLVGYWKMNEAVGTWNGTAGEVIDSSGNGNNGTAAGIVGGTASTTAGKFGNGGSFDGTDDYADAGTGSGLSFSNAITVSVWINKTGTAGGYKGIVDKGRDGYGAWSLNADENGNTVTFKARVSGTNYSITAASNYTINQWEHYVGTFDGSALSIYKNGSLSNSTPVSGTLGTNSVSVRIGAANDGLYFDGKTDEVRIYNRALSDREVRDLYSWAPGPVGWWKMEEGSWNGTTGEVADSSGYGNNGTAVGGATTGSGKFGKAGNFDRLDDYITIANSSSLNVVNLTMSAWIKPSSLPASTHQRLITKNSGSGYLLNIYDSYFEIYIGDQNVAGSTLAAGQWAYITATMDGSWIKLYKNGVLLSNTAYTGTINTGSGSLNLASSNSGTSLFGGNLDEVKIYNYARTPSQILADYGTGQAQKQTVGYWKFDEGYGTNTNNSGNAGSVINGTLTGSTIPTWSNQGKFNKALNFNGTTAYVTVGNNDALNITDAITVSAWVKLQDVGAYYNLIYSRGETVFRVGVLGSGWGGLPLIHIGTTDYYGGLVFPWNTWTHLVFTFDDSKDTVKIYVNGKLDYTTTSATANIPSSSGTATNIGFSVGSGYYAKGDLDEVKIYNYALTADEIKLDYNQGKSLQLGSFSQSSSGVASSSAASLYCVPGSTDPCSPPAGEWKFEEGSGQSAQDTSGNGNTGTLTGATYIAGKSGKGLKFVGNANVVDSGNSSTLNTSSGLTVSMWLKSNTQTPRQFLVNRWYTGTGSVFSTEIQANSLIFYLSNSGGYNGGCAEAGGISASALADNKFHYVSFVFDNTFGKKYYLDGVLKMTDATCSGISLYTGAGQDNVRIGGHLTSGTYGMFDGIIDDVKIYNYSRTPAQIAWDYNRGKPVGYWKMDECQGGTIHDSSGNNNSGTWSGTAGGTQTTVGSCASSSPAGAWYNGATGKRNASLNFDGTDDRVNVGNASSINILTPITLSAWVYPIAGSNGNVISNRNGYSLRINYSGNNEISYYFWDGGAFREFQKTNAIVLNTWNHAVATNDGTNINLYVNGINVYSTVTSYTPAVTSNNTYISTFDGTNEPFRGQIDDARVYNYALTAAQVKEIYNDGAVKFGQ